MFKRKAAVDLGTANTIIMMNGSIVLEEPSIIALDSRTGDLYAVGKQASLMEGKTHEGIKVIRPLKDGVIADFTAAQAMISAFLRKLPRSGLSKILPPSWHVVISIPSSITEVEKRAVRESAEQAGARHVHLVYQPVAAAIGIGLDIRKPFGYMIVDIGGGTTDIAVISNGGIIVDESVRIAGDEMTQNIIDYVREEFNLEIDRRQAEDLKKKVGAAIPDIEDPPPPARVVGRDISRGIPREVEVTHAHVAEAIKSTLDSIQQAILKALSKTPSSLTEDIYNTGIFLTGGGSMIRGIGVWLEKITNLKVNTRDRPLYTVAEGTSRIAENPDEFDFALLE